MNKEKKLLRLLTKEWLTINQIKEKGKNSLYKNWRSYESNLNKLEKQGLVEIMKVSNGFIYYRKKNESSNHKQE